MRQMLSLVLLFSLVSTIAAQSGLARQPDAAKPVQSSDSIAPNSPLPLQPREIKVPAGTPIDIESAHTVSSLDSRYGDFLSFRVLVPIVIDGVTLIEKDSLVTGRVVESKRGRHWGRAGSLAWTMQDVIAIDGSRVPLQAQRDPAAKQSGVKGTSHGGQVATEMIVFGALLFPASPLVLMSGFKRGTDAILPKGKRFVVFVQGETIVKVRSEAK